MAGDSSMIVSHKLTHRTGPICPIRGPLRAHVGSSELSAPPGRCQGGTMPTRATARHWFFDEPNIRCACGWLAAAESSFSAVLTLPLLAGIMTTTAEAPTAEAKEAWDAQD